QAGEGTAYGNLGCAYQSLSDYRKAIEYHEKHLEIAKEIGDRAGEGRAYGNLGTAYQSLGDYRKAIEYHEKRLGCAYKSLGDYGKAIEYQEKRLKIAKEVGDRAGEGKKATTGRQRLFWSDICAWAGGIPARLSRKEIPPLNALHKWMKPPRESEEYSEIRYWAPFQLIEDNVKIEFEVVDDVKK
ncbi:G-protein-signaling modulator 2-like, partial [Acropora millepora]|uniref:G-protein-signaling modulator 2-like n=1 Tax=Acropora millepora TaxID=45264 RepID=UPI001CF10232